MGLLIYKVLNSDYENKELIHTELVKKPSDLDSLFHNLLDYYLAQPSFVVEVFEDLLLVKHIDNPKVEFIIEKISKREKQ
jgi:hypothetical protein